MRGIVSVLAIVNTLIIIAWVIVSLCLSIAWGIKEFALCMTCLVLDVLCVVRVWRSAYKNCNCGKTTRATKKVR